ncbi:hypothetical protein C9439_06400 [archaeon SCG-AAA382B04]|nr:hypothetical protein C9439_06400 [archaeon SCG-AAA382B04]
MGGEGGESKKMKNNRFAKSFISTFLLMFVFWIILSNMFDWIHLSLGIISSLIVAYLSHDLLFTRQNFKKIPLEIYGFIKYFAWLLKEIVIANIDVAKIVLHPDLPVSPRIIKYNSDLESGLSQAIFGNSITLTPGTLTVDIDDDSNYYVHCLAKRHAEGLRDQEMEKRIQEVFKEGESRDDD